jgi:ABC-type transporter Mla maintaining outer membrane lipid asymmetry permease subunit MlaE
VAVIVWLLECWQGFLYACDAKSVGESVARSLVALATWAFVIGLGQAVLK